MALVEPFIDTIVICTMTGLVIILTGVWNATIPTEITLDRGDISYMVERGDGGYRDLETEAEVRIEAGRYVDSGAGSPRLAWHEVPVEILYLDAEQTQPFDGVVDTEADVAIAADGTRITSLYGNAVESGAPLTMLAFQRGLPGEWGKFIVVVSVFLFAISTAIAWSYYGDRCANYLFGHRAVLAYKFAFVTMHFVGAILTLAVVWTLGDVFLGIVILPNLLALLLLSGKVAMETKSYFAREPWIENREVHRRLKEQRRRRPVDR